MQAKLSLKPFPLGVARGLCKAACWPRCMHWWPTVHDQWPHCVTGKLGLLGCVTLPSVLLFRTWAQALYGGWGERFRRGKDISKCEITVGNGLCFAPGDQKNKLNQCQTPRSVWSCMLMAQAGVINCQQGLFHVVVGSEGKWHFHHLLVIRNQRTLQTR